METPNTHNIVKNFFVNNWLTLLLISGAALTFYFGFQRISEITQSNSEMNQMLEDQRNSINENHETIIKLVEPLYIGTVQCLITVEIKELIHVL